jgi:hypothetical protein
MQRLRYDWRLAVRIIGALALVFVAYAHRVPLATQSALPDVQAYAFPDGSLPVICVTGPAEKEPQKQAHALPCDACLVAASVLLPQPEDLADAAFTSSAPALPPAAAGDLSLGTWPPAAPPTAPPLA